MDDLFGPSKVRASGVDAHYESPTSREHVKCPITFDTPSTLDFGSSAISVDCSTDSISQSDIIDTSVSHRDPDLFRSYFDQSNASNNAAHEQSAEWADLSNATAALLDPNVLKMFVDSLTRSITGQEAPSVLTTDPPGYSPLTTPTSSFGANAVSTPMSSKSAVSEGCGGEFTPESAYNAIRRSATNMSLVSNQSGLESGNSTTVMLRNVPYDARQQGVLSLLDEEGFRCQFDFFYAPLDFKSKNNLGYAFINLVSTEVARRFFQHFDGKRTTSRPGWDKPLRVCWARVQGLGSNIDHYRNSPVNEMPTEFKPMLFDGEGVAVPFPAPDMQREESRRSNCHARNSGGPSTVRPRERRLQSQMSSSGQLSSRPGFLTPVAGNSSLTSFMLTKTPQPHGSAAAKLFVGGLSPDTSSEGLEAYMRNFGRVSDCHVLTDSQTGRSRCYGFCTFADMDSAQAALSYTKNHIVDGRGVVVRPYTSGRETHLPISQF